VIIFRRSKTQTEAIRSDGNTEVKHSQDEFRRLQEDILNKEVKMGTRRSITLWVVLMFMVGFVISGMVNAQTKTPAKPPAKIDLNKATPDQLIKCGISASLAKAIVEYRDKSGPFKQPEDLLKVKGMTKEILNKLSPKVEKGEIFLYPSEEDEEEPSLKPSKC
jgi:competence protein ComEA